MRLIVVASLGLLSLFLMYSQFVNVTHADVPSVLGITREKEGNTTLLVVEVRHDAPASKHFIDTVEIDIGGKVESKTITAPQSATTFKVRYAIDAAAAKSQVRVHCNLHGWSPTTREDGGGGSGSGGIPGFPYESILLGIALSASIMWFLRRGSLGARMP